MDFNMLGPATPSSSSTPHPPTALSQRGSIVEQGTHAELMLIPGGLYRRLAVTQAA
jgi:hypothetical protein